MTEPKKHINTHEVRKPRKKLANRKEKKDGSKLLGFWIKDIEVFVPSFWPNFTCKSC